MMTMMMTMMMMAMMMTGDDDDYDDGGCDDDYENFNYSFWNHLITLYYVYSALELIIRTNTRTHTFNRC